MFENVPVDKIGLSNSRKSNLEYLGDDMIEGGSEFGAGTPYGKNIYKMGIHGEWAKRQKPSFVMLVFLSSNLLSLERYGSLK